MSQIHINCTTKPLTKSKPRNWINKGYRILIPFDFKWRVKIGKVKCTCTHCYEEFAPYYGITWFHKEGCAILNLIERRPQILNLNQFYERDIWVIATTD